MTELQNRCLDTFPEWLRTLATDASELAQVLARTSAPEGTRRYVTGGLNYLFKSLDLIPDGIEDLGFLDDAFVLRVAASIALAEVPAAGEDAPVLGRLADEAKLIAELLGKDYARLEAYVRTLTKGAARGRSVDEILADEQIRSAFLHEVTGWASSYET
ncbi:MAG: YkvA family protein, partial [Minicystis sp.]